VSAPLDRPLVAVAGPTGSGKSELALAIAGEFGGEIVSCDSLQIYRHFDIGTAKLPPTERRGIPHHAIGVVDPDQEFSAGEYARMVRPLLAEIAARGRLPVLAGGTGFYLRALLDGLFPGPDRDSDVRARLAAREARRPGSLHRLLRRFDPESAKLIHKGDRHKLIRALEVYLLTQRPLSEAFAAGRDPLRGFRTLKIGLSPPREALYQRLDDRCRRMFEYGLVEEVRGILELGFSPQVKPLEAHGYRQALQLLRGELSYEEAVFHAQRNTRRYAKRQWTWLRQETGVVWLKGFGEEASVQAEAFEAVRNHLKTSH